MAVASPKSSTSKFCEFCPTKDPGDAVSNQPSNVRHVRKSMKTVFANMKHVKTVKKISGNPYRLGYVNGELWVRGGDNLDEIHVYNMELVKVKKLCHKQCKGKYINSVHQVNHNDVFIASDVGLFLCNTEGVIVDKITEGVYTGVCADGQQVMAVDYSENKLIYLEKDGNTWKQQCHFMLTDIDDDDDFVKTLHTVSGDTYVSCALFHKIQQYNKDVLVKEIGCPGEDVGEFYCPFLSGSDPNGHLIICDCNNDRFQLVDPQEGFEVFVVDGVERPHDILVIEDMVFVLHGLTKLSKYEINI